jgi:hypothetical protein
MRALPAGSARPYIASPPAYSHYPAGSQSSHERAVAQGADLFMLAGDDVPFEAPGWQAAGAHDVAGAATCRLAARA